MKEYRLIYPKTDYVSKNKMTWNLNETRHHFQWFLGKIEERISYFLDYLELKNESSHELLLNRISAKVFDLLTHPNFHEIDSNNRRVLQTQGMALSLDMSIFFAELIIKQAENIHWCIGKDKKDEYSYNEPIVCGFRNNFTYDFTHLIKSKNLYSLNVLNAPYDLYKLYKTIYARVS